MKKEIDKVRSYPACPVCGESSHGLCDTCKEDYVTCSVCGITMSNEDAVWDKEVEEYYCGDCQ